MQAASPVFGALPVQGGVGFDVDNLVGLAIVFFAVVWPVIRGLLNVAKSNRQEFQAKTQRGAGPSRSSALDEFLRGLVEGEPDDEQELARQRRTASRSRKRQRAAELEQQQARRAQQEQLRPTPAVDPFDTRAEPQAVAASLGDATEAPPSDRATRAMGAVDGFDVSINGELDEIPSESDLEEGRFTLRDDARRRGPEGAPDEMGLEVLSGEGERAAFALDSKRQSPLARVQGGRSPWQSAILMKEILGSPISVTPHDDQLL